VSPRYVGNFGLLQGSVRQCSEQRFLAGADQFSNVFSEFTDRDEFLGTHVDGNPVGHAVASGKVLQSASRPLRILAVGAQPDDIEVGQAECRYVSPHPAASCTYLVILTGYPSTHRLHPYGEDWPR
jgi:hypothetical protein